tara:strand:+ start:177 stop:542 length:366 start_codon:yes stop_codon:yes gene_type:complete
MTEKQNDNLIGAVILNQLALAYNESLQGTSHYKQNLKRLLKPAIKELIRIEKLQYDKVVEQDEKNTYMLSDKTINVIDTISQGFFFNMIKVGEVLEAYKYDSKSIDGIVKKVLKNKASNGE